MKLFPGARLTVELYTGPGFEAFYKLVIDCRVGKDLLHLQRQFGSDQAVGVQQVIKARPLDSGNTMRDLIQGVALVGTLFCIRLADPETTIVTSVVEHEPRGLHYA